MSGGSWFNRYFFDPIRAAAARASTSSNPVAQQVGAAAVPGGVLVAPALSEDAVAWANLGLDFLEQHAMTYLADLFSHHRAGIAANVAPVAVAA